MINLHKPPADNSQKNWELLVNILRSELIEHGMLYQLLDQQQNCIFKRQISQLAAINHAINSQVTANDRLRCEREHLTRQLSRELLMGEEGNLIDILSQSPQAPQPLVHKLIDELLQLTQRIQRKVSHNQILLARANEVTENILRTLKPCFNERLI